MPQLQLPTVFRQCLFLAFYIHRLNRVALHILETQSVFKDVTYGQALSMSFTRQNAHLVLIYKAYKHAYV